MTRKRRVNWVRVADIFSQREISQSLSRLLDPLRDGISLSVNGTVAVKVNLCLLKGPETGSTVEPAVCKALIAWLNEHFRPKVIYLCEADATHLSADMAFKVLGWYEEFNNYDNVQLLNLSNDERVGPFSDNNLYFSKKMMEADLLISLAKLKTHISEKITCTMKNQFGAIAEKYKIVYHNRLASTICDATLARKPDLCIVDGLIAMEGNGPTNGVPKRTKLLIAGDDAFCTDYFCAKVMGFRPSAVPHLALWMSKGLGTPSYEVLNGDSKDIRLKFKFLPLWKAAIKGSINYFSRFSGEATINEEA